MPTVPENDAHERAHEKLNDPEQSPPMREWLLITHLTEDHDKGPFGDLPSDPAAQAPAR